MAVQKSKQELAAARLSKRLSDLRATLRKDERDMLDQIVCSAVVRFGPEAEVVAHSAVASAVASSVDKTVSFIVTKGVFSAVIK